MTTDWPTCRHRGEALGGAAHRCRHPRLHAPGGVTLAVCRQCAAGGVFCDESSPASSEQPGFSQRTQPCDYLGSIIDRRNARGDRCRCPGKWLRRCEVHGVCTLSDAQRTGVPRCTRCAEYTVEGAACGFANRAKE